MKVSGIEGSLVSSRILNAVPLQNAVLCAECDVVSDSPHDVCMVCGSHSLFSIARVLGGKLPQERASLVTRTTNETSSHVPVLPFPKPHRARKRATAGHRQFAVVAVDHREAEEVERGTLFEPNAR